MASGGREGVDGIGDLAFARIDVVARVTAAELVAQQELDGSAHRGAHLGKDELGAGDRHAVPDVDERARRDLGKDGARRPAGSDPQLGVGDGDVQGVLLVERLVDAKKREVKGLLCPADRGRGVGCRQIDAGADAHSRQLSRANGAPNAQRGQSRKRKSHSPSFQMPSRANSVHILTLARRNSW